MTKKFLFTAIALCAGALANAGILVNNDVGQFVNPTIEHFADTAVVASSYDFGNGMTYRNVDGNLDLVKNTGSYFLGRGNVANGGTDDDWYFATDLPIGTSSTTFEFKFAGGVTRFGFYGAENFVDGDAVQDGLMELKFFDMNDILMNAGPVTADTSDPSFWWGAFYGFESDAGPIGRVVFQNVGTMVLDDVTFEPAAAAAVPEPASIALFGLGLAGFAAARRKTARK